VGSNINDFLKETNKAIEAELVKQQKEATKIILGAYSEIIQESPKDTGLFRHSNFIRKNFKYKREIKPPKTEAERKSKASEHEAKQDSQRSKIETTTLKHGDVISIQNQLSYADALEAGHSTIQAPFGIYGIAEEKIRKEIGKTITIK